MKRSLTRGRVIERGDAVKRGEAKMTDYIRAMGAVECLVEKAAEMGQCWLRGIGTAR